MKTIRNRPYIQCVIFLIPTLIAWYYQSLLVWLFLVFLVINIGLLISAKDERIVSFNDRTIIVYDQDQVLVTIPFDTIIYWVISDIGYDISIFYWSDHDQQSVTIHTNNALVLAYAMNHYLKAKNYKYQKYNQPLEMLSKKIKKGHHAHS